MSWPEGTGGHSPDQGNVYTQRFLLAPALDMWWRGGRDAISSPPLPPSSSPASSYLSHKHTAEAKSRSTGATPSLLAAAPLSPSIYNMTTFPAQHIYDTCQAYDNASDQFRTSS